LRNLVAQKGKTEYHFCAMAGHSKWANIKYRKEKQDKRRSNLFSRLTREIIVCARQDPNPETNPALAQAIERAKAANMPKENIERAIQRAARGLEGTNLQEVIYEGYGPGGVAILLRAYTDNRNRTAAAVRHIFERHGGSLGGEGSVAWQFERRGIIQIKSIPSGMDKETLVLIAAEAGAEDFVEEDETITFYTQPKDLAEVRDALREKGVEIERAVIGFLPKTTVRVEGPEAEQLLKLLDELDENEEIQEVVANFDIPDEILAKVEGS
jgi:YebC/PmpR family DNA-binding regulatory protein